MVNWEAIKSPRTLRRKSDLVAAQPGDFGRTVTAPTTAPPYAEKGGLTDQHGAVVDARTAAERQVAHWNKRYGPDSGGDFLLVSSDKVGFMVHRFHLQCISPVLRGMLINPYMTSLILIDGEMERAAALAIVFDVVYRHPLQDASMSTTAHTLDALRFTDKYDMDMPQRLIMLYARSHLKFKNASASYWVFVVASKFDDVETAVDVLKAAANTTWAVALRTDHNLDANMSGAWVYDPSSWGKWMNDNVNPTYRRALVRAVALTKTKPKEPAAYWADVTKEFEKIMETQKKKPAAPATGELVPAS